jgi:hypothetical protein
MLATAKVRLLVLATLSATLAFSVGGGRVAAQCPAYARDSLDCQPSAFKTPLDQMPTGRVNRQGHPDPTASEADTRAGVALVEEKLHLFRNFEHLHWVPLIPSVKDPATGAFKGGDLDGEGTGRGFAMSGNCIFVGHSTGPGVVHPLTVLKIQPNPEKQPPVIVGEIPTPKGGTEERGRTDDKEIRAVTYEVSPGQDRMVLVRMTGDIVEWHRIDVNTCLPVARSEPFFMAGGPHEFYLWHDPANAKRVLIYMAMRGAGVPDPAYPGRPVADVYAFAVTDEASGDILAKPRVVGAFSLQEVGGPPVEEKPDPTGLYADGRFADFSHLKDRWGDAGEFTTRQSNATHSLTVSDDGERVYMAGAGAGFYVLNSEAIAHSRDVDLAAGKGGCNQRSTIVAANGSIDASKLSDVAKDCLHMVVNDDPGLTTFLASAASPQAKAQRYLVLLTRSRFDVNPPINAPVNGFHSAVFIPGRPSQAKGNTKNRPAYVFTTAETFGCPSAYSRIVSIESEAFPVMVGAYALPDTNIDGCLAVPETGANGQARSRANQHSHNPTVLTNLVFLAHLVDGVRVIDISLPQSPREVGHAITRGQARGYVGFKDRLMYWHDIDNGVHVARYTGPRSDELPPIGSGVYDGNSTSPHR